MKKLILLISIAVLSFFSCSCSKGIKIEIHTEIKNDENSFISINYPIFNIKKLNKYIDNDIKEITKNFEGIEVEFDDGEKELNVDYSYYLINNNIINVVISSYVYDSKESHEKIYTYVFDYKNNKLLTIDDIVTNTNKIKEIVSNNFILTNDSINFYSIINNKISLHSVPINDVELKFEIENNKQETVFNYKKVNKIIDPEKPIIALTFDDGPSKYTDEILNLLEEYDCNATFFVLGNKVSAYKSTVQKMLTLGNEIGNHSYNHKWLSRLSGDDIKEQISKTQNIIKDNTGYTPILLRPTYGAVNQKVRNNTELEIVLWTVDTLDWKITNSKKIANNAISKIKDGSIVLMHDTYERTFKALKIIIPELKNQGYQFVTVSELKQIEKLREKLF